MHTPESPEHFAQHVRRYLYVFYALLFGTLITVGASYIPFGNREINIGVALFIALSKASWWLAISCTWSPSGR